MPIPSQSPMEPPRSERKVLRWKSRKSVLVTATLEEKVRSMTDVSDLAVSASSLASMCVVEQGRGQEDGRVPSHRSFQIRGLLPGQVRIN